MIVSKLIELLKAYDPDTHIAAHMWLPEDVKEVNDNLTDDERDKVIDLVEKWKDCTIGITWETLEVYADMVEGEREK